MTKTEKLFIALINAQLKYVGLTFEDVKGWKGEQEWYEANTLTPEQFEEFREYGIKLIRKAGYNKEKAASEFSWFNLGWGLKVVDNLDRKAELIN